MKTQLLVTLVGDDKPGIVARVTEILVANTANLEESRMAILGGEFAAIMLVTVEDSKVDALKKNLDKLSSEGLVITYKQTKASEAGKGHQSLMLSLKGADHEGIVHSVASYLRKKHVNIESLETGVSPAPVAGTPLFSMTATLQVPSSVKVDELRAKLNEIAKAENVDITLDAKELAASGKK